MKKQQKKYDIAAYIWPAYTGDDLRTRMFWPDGMGEWQSVYNAVKKYPEHNWPRKPLWGYCNEADPYVMEMQINAAADHGVNVFIYDWYWYDGRPFLETCLNNGYLKARNNDRVKFYLMWANHDVNHTWDIRISEHQENIIWQGSVNRQEFEKLALRTIDKYFFHPSYYCIDEKPVFMVYDIKKLVGGLGGAEKTADAFVWWNQQVIKAGLKGIHFQYVSWGANKLNLSGLDADASTVPKELLEQIGFESQSHYQFCHYTNINRDYEEIILDMLKEWDVMENEFDIPYFPHVSIGWDNNPRFKEFRSGVTTNNTPENVKKALEKAKEYIDGHPNQAPLMTINSWNEWTETSYLQPDDLYGYGYLEAVKDVFMDDSDS